MKRNLTSSVCLGALALMSVAAQANTEQTGFYAVANLSHADVERGVGAVDRIDGNNTGYALGLGYSVNRHLAVQATYRDFGEFGATVGCPIDVFCVADTTISVAPFSTDKVSIDGYTLELVGTMGLRDWPVGVSGKIGMMSWDTDWRTNSQLDESANNLLVGVGAHWTPVPRLRWQLDYERIEMDAQTISSGITVRF